MKKYDMDAMCTKCASIDIKDMHQNKFSEGDLPEFESTSRLFGIEPKYHPERIKRTCINCGHSWNELPLDVKVECESRPATKEEIEQLLKCADKPVIEVGDTVEKCGSGGCKVLAMSDGETALYCPTPKNNPVCACYDRVGRLTLIRKGPKVHTFKNAMLTAKSYDPQTRYHNISMVFEGDMGVQLPHNFTLTLTEEVQA